MTRGLLLAAYAVLALLAIACELAARRTGRVATFSEALGALTRRRPLRALELAGWLWLGWHLFVRVHR